MPDRWHAIKAAFIEDPSGFLDLLQREIEQRTVICLELDHAIRCQETVVPLQKLAGGQTALGMAVLWPWIGEVEVDFLNLARRKIFVNIFGVHAQEKKIVTLELLAVVQRTHQNAGIFLDADIIDFRILTCLPE